MKKRDTWKKLESDLEYGSEGLKISLLSLIIIIFLMMIFISFQMTLSEMIFHLLRMPEGNDYIALFGLSILFIVVPFAMAIKLKKK